MSGKLLSRETEPTASVPNTPRASRWKQWLVPAMILLMAAGIVVLIAGNWNRLGQRAGVARNRRRLPAGRPDAPQHQGSGAGGNGSGLRLSAGESGRSARPVARRRFSRAGAAGRSRRALPAKMRSSTTSARRNCRTPASFRQTRGSTRPKRTSRRRRPALRRRNRRSRNAHSGIDAAKADVERTWLERRRQEALIATESATRQKLEQVVADEQRFRAQLASREADLSCGDGATGQPPGRSGPGARSPGEHKAELEAQKRQRAVLDSQELLLHADLSSKRAALSLARTNLDYTRIMAPESGIVSERKVRPGQLVSPGTQVHLAGSKRRLGAGQLQRNAGPPHPRWRPGRNSRGCISRSHLPREGRPGGSRQRLAVRVAAARQRNRQLHKDRAAGTREDRAGSRARQRPSDCGPGYR